MHAVATATDQINKAFKIRDYIAYLSLVFDYRLNYIKNLISNTSMSLRSTYNEYKTLELGIIQCKEYQNKGSFIYLLCNKQIELLWIFDSLELVQSVLDKQNIDLSQFINKYNSMVVLLHYLNKNQSIVYDLFSTFFKGILIPKRNILMSTNHELSYYESDIDTIFNNYQQDALLQIYNFTKDIKKMIYNSQLQTQNDTSYDTILNIMSFLVEKYPIQEKRRAIIEKQISINISEKSSLQSLTNETLNLQIQNAHTNEYHEDISIIEIMTYLAEKISANNNKT
jgi:hypothetical protein